MSVATGRNGELFSTRFPEFAHPIWMRRGTCDITVLFQVLIRDSYDLAGFGQRIALERRYEAQLSNGQTPLILDCGANIGLSTIWFASRFPRAKIIAVKPSPENFALLQKNAAPYDRIEIIEGAVWDTQTLLAIANPNDAPFAHRMIVSDTGLPAYTIEKLCGGPVPEGLRGSLIGCHQKPSVLYRTTGQDDIGGAQPARDPV